MGIDLSALSPRAQKQALAKLAAQNPQAAKIARRVTGSKYGAVRTWIYGLCTDSRKEADYLARCVLLCKAGGLSGFLYHGKFLLVEGTDKDHRAVTYTPDFILLRPDGSYEIIDTKGVETQEFKRTMKILRARYPGVEVSVE